METRTEIETADEIRSLWKDWYLQTSRGRQFWEHRGSSGRESNSQSYLTQLDSAFQFNKTLNPNSADLVYRTLRTEERDVPGIQDDPNHSLAARALQRARAGFEFYGQLQTPAGNWPGDYGGPLFLLPGLIIVSYLTRTPFDAPTQVLMKRYMLNHQNTDGGWGLHIEGHSTMFGTVMQYVALRLLGAESNAPELSNARNWIQINGGATGIPPWGKFYLSLLGLYDWKGNDSLFPELWILPRALPFHPGRYWCHSRMVYLPMSYCYANRICMEANNLILQLREEIFTEPYEQIDWVQMRHACAKTDRHEPLTRLFKVFNRIANAYEKIHHPGLRSRALDFIIEYIDAEDRDTNFVDIGPVNQILNSLCVWHRYGAGSRQFRAHVDRWKDYLWLAEDGMKMNGYNGSQLWDTAFAGQALVACQLMDELPGIASGIFKYLDLTQIDRDPDDAERYFRTRSKGGWPFSTIEHGWPITDCTAEAMKTVIDLTKEGQTGEFGAFNPERFNGAIDYLLSTQNADGGWGSYEEVRAPMWLEQLNPSRIFSGIMPEHTYVECSSATIQALNKFRNGFPGIRSEEIAKAIHRGTDYLRSRQRSDGSWYGSWGICFTYATWFGIEGLIAGGQQTYRDGNPSDEIGKACKFLIDHQKEDGSWGESYLSCVERRYVHHEEGQVVNTAWALLALMAAGYPGKEVVERGVQFLFSKQEPDGDWPQQAISGVFNSNCMITYTAYRNVFPLWALGRYAHRYA